MRRAGIVQQVSRIMVSGQKAESRMLKAKGRCAAGSNRLSVPPAGRCGRDSEIAFELRAVKIKKDARKRRRIQKLRGAIEIARYLEKIK